MSEEKRTMTWEEFAKKHPEYVAKRKKKKTAKMQYLCLCKNCSHTFDYRDRIKFTEKEDLKHYAPCQGMCPRCYSTRFTFVNSGNNVYPIKFNFLG